MKFVLSNIISKQKNCISLTLFNPNANNVFHHVNGYRQSMQNLAVKNCLRVIGEAE